MMEKVTPGILWILSAPSGAGKTSLAKALVASTSRLRHSVSYTTRAPRPGEVDGVDYHFVSREAFADLAAAGDFLEHARVHGNDYGTSEKWVKEQLLAGTDCLLEIDWQGARQVRERLPGHAVSVFILPPSLEDLGERLRGRAQDDEAVIRQRLAAARDEMMHFDEYDYVLVNDEFERALEDLRAIYRAEHLRGDRQGEGLRERMRTVLGLAGPLVTPS